MRTPGHTRSAMTRRAAFTLLELIAALGISTILLAGLASAVRITLLANQVPDTIRATLDASDIITDIADEVRYAIYMTERSDRVLQFAVPDMDEDGIDDVIRYEWSGTAGDPLTRTFNFGTPLVLAGDVQDFNLSYLLRSQEESFTGLVESSEQKFTKYTGDLNKTERPITSNEWLGQYFHPDEFTDTPLPPDAVSWKVTKVKLENRDYIQQTGQSWIQMREATGQKTPTSNVFEQILLDESSLGGWSYRTYQFNNMPRLHSAQGLCLVVEWIGPDVPVSLRSDTAASGLLRSTDQGASFTYDAAQTLRYEIHGTYRSPGGTQTVTRRFVTGVHVSLRLGDVETTQHSTIPVINMPESLSRFWKLDFDIDPTLTDVDFDDTADWKVRGGGSFDTGKLNLGIWDADDSVLDTTPDSNFDKLTTVVARMRNTTVGGEGAVLEISADHSGGKRIPVKISLALQSGGTQTLTARKKIDDTTWVTLDQATGLGPGFVDVRLVIDPDSNTMMVSYDGVELGAYDYLPFSQGTADRFASLYEDVSDAEFDFVSIRVSDP